MDFSVERLYPFGQLVTVHVHPFLQSLLWLSDLSEGKWIMIEGVLIIVIAGGFIGSLLCSRLFAVLSIMFISFR